MKCILSTIMALGSLMAFGQPYLEVLDNDSTETNEERLEMMLDFMKDLEFEKAVDIGSGNLNFILQIANAHPHKNFVLEDIDSTFCNQVTMRKCIDTLHLNNLDANRIQFQIGDENSTLLPDNSVDLILISGLIHEVFLQEAFFIDLDRILIKDGRIIISDAIYPSKPKPHHGCENAFLTHEEFDQLLERHQLIVNKEWRRIGIRTNSNGPYSSCYVECSFFNKQ